ncbi:MAG: alpha/beta fold hydrolase [Solirubrobacteraceae bacterium]
MHHARTGHGKPLLLIHGLGSSLRTWDTIRESLAAQREVVAIDLPGFGATPPLAGKPTIAALTDAIVTFLTESELSGVDVVGSSMGARIALELARRGEVGATVALAPGGFWTPSEGRSFDPAGAGAATGDAVSDRQSGRPHDPVRAVLRPSVGAARGRDAQ